MTDIPYHRIGFSGDVTLWAWIAGELHTETYTGVMRRRPTHQTAFDACFGPGRPMEALGRHDPQLQLVSARGEMTPAIRKALVMEFPDAPIVEF